MSRNYLPSAMGLDHPQYCSARQAMAKVGTLRKIPKFAPNRASYSLCNTNHTTRIGSQIFNAPFYWRIN
jgi:hypothetical protein